MKKSLPKSVDVIDVTLRDGFQHEEIFVPTEAKLWIAERLMNAGFKRIEIGTFSHMKYVPQFKDILELLKSLPRRDDVEYTVLALNTKACERVAQALEEGVQIDRVLCGQLATSEAYAKKNMNRTHEELFLEAEKNVKFLHSLGIKKVLPISEPFSDARFKERFPLRGHMNLWIERSILDLMKSNTPIRMESQIRRRSIPISLM